MGIVPVSIVDVDPQAPDVALWYLSHDAKEAAAQVPDALLYRAVQDACRVLVQVWAAVAPDKLATDWLPPSPDVVPYTPPGELGALVTKLHGQRVYNPAPGPGAALRALANWAGEKAGNYAWVWRHGFELVQVISKCHGSPHGALPVLWVLEWPPETLELDWQHTEPPSVVHTPVYVQEDGHDYVDALATYRAYLLRHKGPRMQWIKRDVPDWAKEVCRDTVQEE